MEKPSVAERQLLQLASLVGSHVQESRISVVSMRQEVAAVQRRFSEDAARLSSELGNIEAAYESTQMDLQAAVVERDMAKAAAMLPPATGTDHGAATLNNTMAGTTSSGMHQAAAQAAATPFSGTAGSAVLAAHMRGARSALMGGRDVDSEFQQQANTSLLLTHASRLNSVLAAAVGSPHAPATVCALRKALETDGCGPVQTVHTPRVGAVQDYDGLDGSSDEDDSDDGRPRRQRKNRRHGGQQQQQPFGAPSALSDIDRGIVALRRVATFMAIAFGVSEVRSVDGAEADEAVVTDREEEAMRPVVIAWMQERLQQLRRAAGGESPRARSRSPLQRSPRHHPAASPQQGFGEPLAVVGRHNAGAHRKPVRQGRVLPAVAHTSTVGSGGASITVSSRAAVPMLPTGTTPQPGDALTGGDDATPAGSMGALHPSPAVAQAHFARLGNQFIQRHVAEERTSPKRALSEAMQAQAERRRRGGKKHAMPDPGTSGHFESVISSTSGVMRQRMGHNTAHLRQEVRIVQHTASLIGPAGKGLRQEHAEAVQDQVQMLVPTSYNTAATLNDTSDVTRVGKEAQAAASAPEALAAAAAAAEAESKRLEQRRAQLGVGATTGQQSPQPYFDDLSHGALSSQAANRILGRRLQSSAYFVVDEERAKNKQRVYEKMDTKPVRSDVGKVVVHQT